MSKLVNLITGLFGFGLFAVFIIGLSHSISTGFAGFMGGLPFMMPRPTCYGTIWGPSPPADGRHKSAGVTFVQGRRTPVCLSLRRLASPLSSFAIVAACLQSVESVRSIGYESPPRSRRGRSLELPVTV